MTEQLKVTRIVAVCLMPLLLACGSPRMEHYNDLAIRCAQAGLWKEATYRWQQVLELDPDYPPAHNNLGVAYEAQGEFDDALAAYDQAIRLDPTNRAYSVNRSRCLNRKNQETPQTASE